MSGEQYVCATHFDDPYLAGLVQADIARLGPNGPPCSICGPGGPGGRGAELGPILDVVEVGLRRFYAEGDDRWDDPIDTRDVLASLEGIDDEIVELAIAEIGDHDWVPGRRSGHDEVEMLSFGWEEFVHHVRHVSRYMLDTTTFGGRYAGDAWLSPEEVLPAIAEAIQAEPSLVAKLDRNTNVFRARTFNKDAPFKELHALVAPPPDKAAQGRMNAAGIAVLYAGLDDATAVAEVYDGKTSVAVVTMRPMRDLTVLDLTAIAQMSPYDPSVDARRFSMLGFLRSFASAIAEPVIRDGRVHHEYAPTQMASEFFHWRLLAGGEPLDGIIYPSWRAGGRNLVLFVGQEECLADEYLREGQRRSVGRPQVLTCDPIVRVMHYDPPQATAGGVLRLLSDADIRTVF